MERMRQIEGSLERAIINALRSSYSRAGSAAGGTGKEKSKEKGSEATNGAREAAPEPELMLSTPKRRTAAILFIHSMFAEAWKDAEANNPREVARKLLLIARSYAELATIDKKILCIDKAKEEMENANETAKMAKLVLIHIKSSYATNSDAKALVPQVPKEVHDYISRRVIIPTNKARNQKLNDEMKGYHIYGI
ncbi:MAG: hypothetical protein QXF01_01515 [Candidatus Micrarchaeaceae archaeon]